MSQQVVKVKLPSGEVETFKAKNERDTLVKFAPGSELLLVTDNRDVVYKLYAAGHWVEAWTAVE